MTSRGRRAREMSHDRKTVEGFGQEWRKFDHSSADVAELRRIFTSYFTLFPWNDLRPDAIGLDVGCGTGRWAMLAAPRVGALIALDPSAEALDVAKERTAGIDNCYLVQGAAGTLPFRDGSFDFMYSLGVLHHTPQPIKAIADCVRKLKVEQPFLVYLYYALDSRPQWYKAIWRASNVVRIGVSRLPFRVRLMASSVVAGVVYLPMARAARLAERRDVDVDVWPLAFYRHRSFYVMRNDALDRLGTRLEHRFTRGEVRALMEAGGLNRIEVDPTPPYWCAIGYRASAER